MSLFPCAYCGAELPASGMCSCGENQARPNVNAGRRRLRGVLTRIALAGLEPDEDIGEEIDLVLGALDGYLVCDGELIACSDREIADAKAKLSAALREALEIPVEVAVR